MPAKFRSLLCAAFIPCGERNSNVSDPPETCIRRPPFAALAHSVFILWWPFRTSHSLFLLSILREMPGGRMAGKVKGKIVTLAKRKQGGEDDSCRTDAPQLR